MRERESEMCQQRNYVHWWLGVGEAWWEGRMILLAALLHVWFHLICVSLWVFKHNAICWLLCAGWVCYIFTVSVMINFSLPHVVLSSPHSRAYHYSETPLTAGCLFCKNALIYYLFVCLFSPSHLYFVLFLSGFYLSCVFLLQLITEEALPAAFTG